MEPLLFYFFLRPQKKRKRETRKDTKTEGTAEANQKRGQKKQRHSQEGEEDSAKEELVKRITGLAEFLNFTRPRNFDVPELKRWLKTMGKVAPSEIPTKKLDLLKRVLAVLEQKKYEFPVKKSQ